MIPTKPPVTDAEPVTHEVSIADTTLTKPVGPYTQEKEIIPSKNDVFQRIKMKSKHKSRSPLINVVRNPQKKKKSTMIISSESTNEADETILETLKANIQKDTSTPSQTVVIPLEESVDKSFYDEARTSDILVNVSITDANVIMGEDDSKKDDQGKPLTNTSETFVSFLPQITPAIPITSTTDSPTFKNLIKHPFTSLLLFSIH
ncbi:unnamed protein product [Lactuca saligna]|uniref:Uncharacterized protein n=1 Tax=Lactuca saligna TaxID=75948 RepID=A0AA36EM58_LACSI|nr:unnamed protein product [Lactuca saligna]